MAERMKWTKDCRLGIDHIDSQHRLLFAIANELIDFENPMEEAPEFKFLLNHLRQYVDDHFKSEEKYMQNIQYPDLDDHTQKHQEIVEEINELLKGIKTLNELKEKMDVLLKKWIKEHILMEDKKIADWMEITKKDSNQETSK